MNKEYYHNHLPYIEDRELEKEFVLWLISLDLSEDNARKVCHYLTEIITDKLASIKPSINPLKNLMYIIEREVPLSIQDKYRGDIYDAIMQIHSFDKP